MTITAMAYLCFPHIKDERYGYYDVRITVEHYVKLPKLEDFFVFARELNNPSMQQLKRMEAKLALGVRPRTAKRHT